MEKDFYAVLGVDAATSQKDITKAYRRLARDLHPDTHPDDPTAEERFKDVSHAYDVLGDATKRQEYDDFRRMVADAAAQEAGGGPSGGFDSSYGSGRFRSGGFDFDAGDFEDVIDLDDLLGGMFGARAQRRARPDRG